ncbi:MAG: AMP-binding protein, partial [Cyanothece sp. SIO2G6]|nr:AMP-binding protein [Cyanothece sp. SIO2G6]
MDKMQLKHQAIANKLAEVPIQKRNALLKRLAQDGINPLSLPIVPTAPTEMAPLSWSQERLWFLEQFETTRTLYNLPVVMRVDGSLRLDWLQNILNAIAHRHHILSTTFQSVDDQVVQVQHPGGHWPLRVEDWRDQGYSVQDSSVQAFIQREVAKPFDLTTGPLVRATAIQLADTVTILLLDRHHIVWDGWSTDQFSQELAQRFTAYHHGQVPELPPLPIQYADYAQWERQWFVVEAYKQQLAYWQTQLADAPALLQLPTDYPRPPEQQFRGWTHTVSLGTTLSQQVKAIAQQQGVTVFMVLLAAFQVLLARYSGQSDIVVGTPIAHRQRPELEPLIGFFVNTLALRTQVDTAETVADLLQSVRTTTLDAYAHQDVPFERVVDALNPGRSLAYAPLLQVMFVLQPAAQALELPGITLTPMAMETHTAKFDLTLTLEEVDPGFTSHWEYNTDLFAVETISRMAQHFETLLGAMVQDGTQAIASLPLMRPTEYQQLLQQWNPAIVPSSTVATTQAEPFGDTHLCLHQLFEAQVDRTPEAIALSFETQSLSYRKLNAQANQLAHHLKTLGVGPESLVGLCVDRSLDMVIGLLAILKAGGAYVPLDPHYPAIRLEFMLKDADITVLLTQQHHVGTLPPHTAKVVCMDN